MNVISHPHKNLRRVFVWELPVRVYHWVNALCILVLIGTGFIIGDPPAILTGREAYQNYWFGTTRFIHFLAAYVFLFNFAFRIYWGFVGNQFASWRNFIPTSKKFFSDMWMVMKTDIFMTKREEEKSIGHNRLAGAIYFLTFIAFGIQCLTGFGLYAAMSDWWLPNLFTWVAPLFGGDFMLRQIHHWAMWFFILFTVIHVYLVFYHDYVEGRGELSSMAGGWKFIEEEVFEENTKEKK
ncbi:MAG: Ni/Fe-hydrogenase, b-type cytochrome subunit [Cyclobacteriaceae bacterium]|jgi:Ni/Fe-hydrogenase 1 B-type cytochrome subunit|nr:Ni/Fe-hydrogenase, b-type cytochrome subunit [Flammeovirgaceae bacterium]